MKPQKIFFKIFSLEFISHLPISQELVKKRFISNSNVSWKILSNLFSTVTIKQCCTEQDMLVKMPSLWVSFVEECPRPWCRFQSFSVSRRPGLPPCAFPRVRVLSGFGVFRPAQVVSDQEGTTALSFLKFLSNATAWISRQTHPNSFSWVLNVESWASGQ